MKAIPQWYWLNGTPYCTACVECDDPAMSPEDIAASTRGPASEVLRCCCCGARDGDDVARDEYVDCEELDEVAMREDGRLRDALSVDVVEPTFAYFALLADRWASLGKRQRAAAIAIARGSMDTATDILGPRYLSRADAREGIESPAWGDITDLLFDIDESGFNVPSHRS